jgi:hypothetical protein
LAYGNESKGFESLGVIPWVAVWRDKWRWANIRAR